MTVMILYHRTDREAAETILRQGFRDGIGQYMSNTTHSGVWLSNVPLDENEGAFGDILLEVSTDMPESEIAQYEWIEEGKGFREFLIPAAEINSRMKIRIVEDRRGWTPDWYRSDDPRNKQP
jgi:hypothetical protein